MYVSDTVFFLMALQNIPLKVKNGHLECIVEVFSCVAVVGYVYWCYSKIIALWGSQDTDNKYVVYVSK